ncbi:guanine nucleotide exchange protein for ADP-robosylation factor [Chytriomyces hyalinus]|nr:guanine nucleotide exchange protein for ADP-robosylation factor [Chytriomyces hyalinus]
MSQTASPGGSAVFIRIALDQLSKTNDCKKIDGLPDAIEKAQKALENGDGSGNPVESGEKEADTEAGPMIAAEEVDQHSLLLKPLLLACSAKSVSLSMIAVDCLGKLFAYSYFNSDDSNAAAAVNAICETNVGAASQSENEKLLLQVVKALSAAVLSVSATSPGNGNTKITSGSIHDAVLLRSIRTTFIVFLIAKSPATQIVAQASLTQMVQAICARVPSSPAPFGKVGADAEPFEMPDSDTAAQFDRNIRDVHVVMKAFCKLGMKPLPEGSTDLKSQAMRTKLLSLHLIHTIMCSHMHLFFLNTPTLFTASSAPANESIDAKKSSLSDSIDGLSIDVEDMDPATPMTTTSSHFPLPSTLITTTVDTNTPTLFIHAIKPYLCLCLTRNAVSVVPQVFDVSMEIFGKVFVDLRVFLKREISVIFTEILLPILESKSTLITFHQRTSLLKILSSLLASSPDAGGGRMLVEIYLNYDCDPEATTTKENIWERFVTLLSRLVTQHHVGGSGGGSPNPGPNSSSTNYQGGSLNAAVSGSSIHNTKSSVIRPMTTQSLTSFTKEQLKELYSTNGDFAELKRRGVDVLVKGVLGPLVHWGWDKWVASNGDMQSQQQQSTEQLSSGEDAASLELLSDGVSGTLAGAGSAGITGSNGGLNSDDPMQFEVLRTKKQNLMEGIKAFNIKPKKGIQLLLDNKSIASRTSNEIATFLLNTEGLDKIMIGEFLGEPAEENVAIMHAFVDHQDFASVPFVTALRNFLQRFRLPGEAQKIDRYMLKFAERFVLQNPGKFSSADTAYVLAYSVIMLNTDQHNAQVKKRMTKADFLKNNRGIDGEQDLPVDLMEGIYDEIRTNEIVLKDEQPAVSEPDKLPTSVRFEKASESMAIKTEERLKASNQRRAQLGSTGSLANCGTSASNEEDAPFNQSGNSGVFYSATHHEHLKSMFEIVWMSVFTALSSYLQDAEDADSVALALEGFKHAITLACMFDLDLERKAFMSTLGKFAQISVGSEIRPKNLEAVKVLLEMSRVLGARLGDGWMEIVLCISNLEKLQSPEGSDRSSMDKKRDSIAAKKENKYSEEAVALATSQSMTLLVDKIFTSSVRLSGPAIVGFVKALCAVSWDEITSSETSTHPRMYCLQRLVEISYYNMNRIRVEWSQLWSILGPHFNKVATHSNSQISFFALDKLRQLAMKFLELEELPNFKFQRDFLRPFEYVLGASRDFKMKEMALMCLQQLVQGKSKALKSGWKTLFGSLEKASKDENEQVVTLAFDLVKMLFKSHFESVSVNGAFPDYVNCLHPAVDSLQSVELMKQTVPVIVNLQKSISKASSVVDGKAEVANASSNSHKSANGHEETAATAVLTTDDPNFRYMFPILFGFYEVTMTCELEVRARGLTYLFDVLKSQARELSRDSWEVIAKGVLFPIFDDLKLSRQEHRKIDEREDLTVWLSTTLVQALRLLVDLFTNQFEILQFACEGVLEIMMACMSQENETLARIGSTCLHQFIENNLEKFDSALWDRICKTFVNLFASTSPNLLFFDYHAQIPDAPGGVFAPPEGDEADQLEQQTRDEEAEDEDRDVGAENMNRHMSATSLNQSSSPNFPSDALVFVDGIPQLTGRTKPDKSEFQGIILKCVLHLLVVQTLHEILTTSVSKSSSNLTAAENGATGSMDERIYRSMSVKHLLLLVGCFERSYRFAEAFNKDTELRLALFKMGFMKQLPNLLKQECASISAYISILFKMVVDEQQDRVESRLEIAGKLIPLCHQVLCNFNAMEPGIKNRNLNAWKPVIILILNALTELDDKLFQQYLPVLFEEAMSILLQPALDLEVRIALHAFVIRVGFSCGIVRDPVGAEDAAPVSVLVSASTNEAASV